MAYDESSDGWYELNDSYVREISMEEVLHRSSGGGRGNGDYYYYSSSGEGPMVLLYERITEDDVVEGGTRTLPVDVKERLSPIRKKPRAADDQDEEKETTTTTTTTTIRKNPVFDLEEVLEDVVDTTIKEDIIIQDRPIVVVGPSSGGSTHGKASLYDDDMSSSASDKEYLPHPPPSPSRRALKTTATTSTTTTTTAFQGMASVLSTTLKAGRKDDDYIASKASVTPPTTLSSPVTPYLLDHHQQSPDDHYHHHHHLSSDVAPSSPMGSGMEVLEEGNLLLFGQQEDAADEVHIAMDVDEEKEEEEDANVVVVVEPRHHDATLSPPTTTTTTTTTTTRISPKEPGKVELFCKSVKGNFKLMSSKLAKGKEVLAKVVYELKARCGGKSPGNVSLSFRDKGKEKPLGYHQTLSSQNISDGSTLIAKIQSVCSGGGGEYRSKEGGFRTTTTTTTRPSTTMELMVTPANGKGSKHAYKCTTRTTAQQLIHQVCERTGSNPRMMSLSFNGKNLSGDDAVLYHEGVRDGSHLHFVFSYMGGGKFQVLVKLDNRQANQVYQIDSTTTGHDLLHMVKERVGSKGTDMRLAFNGKHIPLGDTLMSHGVKEASLVVVTVRYVGGGWEHEMMGNSSKPGQPRTTVVDVREEHHHHHHHHHHALPRLSLERQQVEVSATTTQEEVCGGGGGMVAFRTPAPTNPSTMQVIVTSNSGSGGRHIYTINNDATAQQLIQRVCERTGGDANIMSLACNGRQLVGDVVLHKEGVREGSHLQVACRFVGGGEIQVIVQVTIKVKKQVYRISTTTTGQELVQQVVERVGELEGGINLVFNGKTLPLTNPVTHHGVKEGSLLVVTVKFGGGMKYECCVGASEDCGYLVKLPCGSAICGECFYQWVSCCW